MPKITAVAKSTGRKVSIPEHWLDHPVLGKDFKLPPSATGRAQTSDQDPADDLDVDVQPTDVIGEPAGDDQGSGIAAAPTIESPSGGEEE